MRCRKGEEEKEAFHNSSLGKNLHKYSNNKVQKKRTKERKKSFSAAGLLEQSVVSPAWSLNTKYWGNYETEAHPGLTFRRKATPGFTLRLQFWYRWPADQQTGSRLPPPRWDQDLKQEGAPVACCNQCRSCDEGRQVAALGDEQPKQWKGVEGFFLMGF